MRNAVKIRQNASSVQIRARAEPRSRHATSQRAESPDSGDIIWSIGSLASPCLARAGNPNAAGADQPVPGALLLDPSTAYMATTISSFQHLSTGGKVPLLRR